MIAVTNSHSIGYQGGEEEATQAYGFVHRYPASKASVEGEAPSGFAGGGGDASPYDRGADDEANAGSRMKADWYDRR